MRAFTLIQVLAFTVSNKPDEFHEARVIVPFNSVVKMTELLAISEDDKDFYKAGGKTEIILANNDTIVVKESVDDLFAILTKTGD